MSAGAHVGRSAALVVALGVGMAAGTGVAWADTSGSGSESSTSTSSASESSSEQTSSSTSSDNTTPKPRKPIVSHSAAAGSDSAAGGTKPAKKIADAVRRAVSASVDDDDAPAATHSPVDTETSSSPTTPKSRRPTISLTGYRVDVPSRYPRARASAR
jgi:hypothetical protein